MSEINRDTLMAYADGQLDHASRQHVDAYLTANPDTAAEIALMQRQSDAIRTLFAPAGAEPVPARLKPRRIAAEQSRHPGVLSAGLRQRYSCSAWAWVPAGSCGRCWTADRQARR